MQNFTIGKYPIGAESPPLIIAEIGQAHDGSLGTAHAFIDAVADIGVEAIKFQTHIADSESTLDEAFRVHFSRQDATRYDYWRRMEFSEEEWRGLAEHAREKGLLFMSSAFSVEAVRILAAIGMPVWKIGSGEFKSLDLMEAMAVTGAPFLLSTGMCSYADVEERVAWFRKKGINFALMQCTSKYPVQYQEVGLNVLEEYRARFHCPVGLSDHSGAIYPGLAALSMGANLLEVHVTFDKRLFGPDVASSVTLEDLQILREARDAFWIMHTHPVNKDVLAEDHSKMCALFTKSIAPVRDLPAGTVLQADMLTVKKPGTGIPPENKEDILGRRLKRDVTSMRLLSWSDIE
ncbi:MAG: N-acetylneuraminate synthase family protein [Desulfomonilia bacterium]